MIYSRRLAQEMHVPIDWTAFTQKASQDAERAAAVQLLEQATSEDFEALKSLALLHMGTIEELKQQLASATFAANLNADTVREQQVQIRRLEEENAEMARQLGITEQLKAARSKS